VTVDVAVTLALSPASGYLLAATERRGQGTDAAAEAVAESEAAAERSALLATVARTGHIQEPAGELALFKRRAPRWQKKAESQREGNIHIDTVAPDERDRVQVIVHINANGEPGQARVEHHPAADHA
jgi:hypothetical protein